MRNAFTSMKIIVILAAVMAGYNQARALNLRTLEPEISFRSYNDRSSAESSTHSVTGIGISYAVYVVGSSCAYTIHHTTRTYPTSMDLGPSISSSVVHIAVDGVPVNGEFRGVTIDPKIIISGLNTAATAHVFIEYGVRKEP